MSYRLPISSALSGPFADWLGEDDWSAWYAAIKAIFAEPLSRKEQLIFSRCTGLEEPPVDPIKEAWFVVGRKGRKSAVAAVIAVYAAAYGKWRRAQGERLRVIVISQSKWQARLVRDYALAILQSNRGLARLIESDSAESIGLNNGVDIVCLPNSYRSVRGPTVVAAIFDEVAFWRSEESANPDIEVLRAVKPAMIPHPNAVLIGLSSPYARRGLLYERHRDHYGKPSNILVWQAPTETMNPQIDPAEIEKAYVEDEAWARAEFGAEFRSDIEQFLSVEAIQSCVMAGVYEMPPKPDQRYFAFCDPSGGSNDSMTLAVAHREPATDVAVLDLVREVVPPFQPKSVVAEFAQTLRPYRISRLHGDRYGGAWVSEAFKEHGIAYWPADRSKSDLYLELPPAINSQKAKLLDHQRLIGQLMNLERRTARGGRDSIDHPRAMHDDVANAAAGALVLALEELRFAPRCSFGAPIIIGEGLVDEHRIMSREIADRDRLIREADERRRQRA